MPDQMMDAEAAQAAPPPPFNQTSAVRPPTPGEVAARQPQQVPDHPRQEPQQPPTPTPEPQHQQPGDKPERAPRTPEDYEKMIADLRKENAERRIKLKELEPLAQQAREAEEAQKTEVQKAIERAEAAERRDAEREANFQRLDLAVTHGIIPDNIDLIGSGTREEMEAKALKVKAMQDAQAVTAPPSDRPVEGLRPGASPEPPQPADDSYPESWKPSHIRERERSQYGQ